VKADSKTKTAVVATLNRMAKAYEKRDLKGLLAVWARDPDVTVIGTGPDEKRVGIAELKTQFQRDWAQSEAASIKLGKVSVSAAGPAAWLMSDATINVKVAGKESSFPGRLTGVMEKRGKKWLLAQMHISVPYGDQAEGQSWPSESA